MITLDGDFFDGKSSQKKAVQFRRYDDGTVFIYEAENDQKKLAQFHESEINVSSRLGNTPRYLNFAAGQTLETLNNDGVDQWLRIARPSKLNNFIHRLESHWRFVALCLVMVVLVIWGSVQYGVPAASKAIAFALPADLLNRSSKEVLAVMDAQWFAPSELSEERKHQLQQHFAHAIAQHPEQNIRVEFRSAESIGANAFALPNGTVIFTDDMVNLAEHDDELLSVLGHEIGHVVHRHSLRRIVQNSMFIFLLALLTGDVSGTAEVLLGIPVIFTELAYSRKYELEADDYARQWLIENNIPLHRFADLMRRVTHTEIDEGEVDEKDDSDRWLKYLSTHPDTNKRLEAFE